MSIHIYFKQMLNHIISLLMKINTIFLCFFSQEERMKREMGAQKDKQELFYLADIDNELR